MLAVPEAFPQLEELDLSGVRGAALSSIATCVARIPSLCVVSIDRLDSRQLTAGAEGVFVPDASRRTDDDIDGAALAFGHVRSLSCKHFPPILSLRSLMPVLDAVLAVSLPDESEFDSSSTSDDDDDGGNDGSGGAGREDRAAAASQAAPSSPQSHTATADHEAAADAMTPPSLEEQVEEAGRRVAVFGDAPLAWETLDASGTVTTLDARAHAPMLPDSARAPFHCESGLTDAGLAILGAAAPRLRSVSLAFTSSVRVMPQAAGTATSTGTGASAATADEPDIVHSTGVSDRGLELLVAGVCGPRLTSVDLAACTWLSDSGLVAMGQRCPSLRFLNLAACTGISDEGLLALVQPRGCAGGLEAINLTRCDGVSAAGVRRMLMGAPRCGSVVVTRSGAADLDALESLASSFPKVQFATRDPRCFVDPSASQLVPGFKAPPASESFDRRIRNKLGMRIAKSKKAKKGKGRK
jgi:hypothetical protein